MSGTTTVNNFNVGRDAQAVVVTPSGGRLDFSKVTDIKHTSEYDTATSKPLNSAKQERYLPNGHKFSFSFDRRDPSNETTFQQLELAWWAVGSADPGTSPGWSVYIYITEVTGAQTTHQFTGASIKFGGIGDIKADSAIKQTIEGHAQYWKS